MTVELTIALAVLAVNTVLQIATLYKHSSCESPCFKFSTNNPPDNNNTEE